MHVDGGRGTDKRHRFLSRSLVASDISTVLHEPVFKPRRQTRRKGFLY